MRKLYFLTAILTFIFSISLQAQTQCSCWQQRDTSFHYVPFYIDESGTTPTPPYYRNDDGITRAIILPFNFCFWGTTEDSVHINNNGNISFGRGFPGYSTFGFPMSREKVIAPFWADVDTRGGTGGTDVVVYKVTQHYMIVQWDSVGFYESHSNRHNSFQLIISDGTDPIIPNGGNVEFCYQEMSWTTGDANDDTNGYGGNPATIGANKGDSVSYVQVGKFDIAGDQYRGQYPQWPYDGVQWLDNKPFNFNLCSTNIAPISVGVSPCDTLEICGTDSIIIPFYFLAGNQGDTVWANIAPPSIPGITVTDYPGTTDSVIFKAVASRSNYGIHTINLYAYDNSHPSDTTYASFVLQIGSISIATDSTPDNGSCNGSATVHPNGGIPPYTYLWSTGGTTNSITNQCHGSYCCTIADAAGCTDSVCVSIPSSTGIANNKLSNGITVLSNPSNGIFTFQVSNSEKLQIFSIEVYNMIGQQVYSASSNFNSQLSINLSNQPDGVYLYRFISKNGSLIDDGKLIIQK